METTPGADFVPQNISTKVQPFSRDWIISFKDPRLLWSENWFALVFEVVSAIIVFQLFRNAKRNGSKSAYLLLTALSAAITFELVQAFPHSGYQLWWYHQGFVNILKQRVPSYVITHYALVHFISHSLTNGSNLPKMSRSLVTAVCGTLIMFPCLWLAPRLLLVLLHFDDPIFKEQILGVPYIQILVVFLQFFHTSHLFEQFYEEIEPRERNTYSLVKISVQAGMLTGIYTLVEQYLLYILINLIMRFHPAICLAAAVLILLWLSKDEIKGMEPTSYTFQGIASPLMKREFWIVAGALLFTSTLPLWLNTFNLKSTGDRLELGPCLISHDVSNSSPLEITRRRFVCPDDAYHLDFDFHCVTNKELYLGVANKTKHYTICGKSLQNTQMIARNFSMYSVGCLTVFYILMLFSFNFKAQATQTNECKKVE